MIDIVTVVFGEEIPILACQAQSLDLYCQDIGLQKIYVMVNEPDLADKIDITWWGSLSAKVQIIPQEQFNVKWIDNGWLTQQLLKMYGSALSQNQWSMVLDAKTVLTKKFTLDHLLTGQGQIRLGWFPTIGVFEPAQRIANRLFGTDNHLTLELGGVPFFFHNASMRDMIEHIETLVEKDFGAWFLDQGMLTEFVLYSTWISLDAVRKDLYKFANPNHLRICHICHSTADQFDRILSDHNADIHTLSIHRKAWSGLTIDQKLSFQQKLLDRGISRAKVLV